jgi:isopentenyldiphosphate isomerase|tara:strand:- start:18875 stop:19285 length:411 start_codon:yes stop_codon:yes gene_type:complete
MVFKDLDNKIYKEKNSLNLMIQRNVVIAIILNNNNEVLLQKKDLGHPWLPGKWCFFGGKLEEGSNSKDILKEILKRKIGIEVDIIKFLKTSPYKIEHSKGIEEGEDYIYLCRFNGKLSDIKLDEGAGFAFLDKKEL